MLPRPAAAAQTPCCCAHTRCARMGPGCCATAFARAACAGFFNGALSAPQLLIVQDRIPAGTTGAKYNASLPIYVAKGDGTCSQWATFVGTPLTVSVLDINQDGNMGRRNFFYFISYYCLPAWSAEGCKGGGPSVYGWRPRRPAHAATHTLPAAHTLWLRHSGLL